MTVDFEKKNQPKKYTLKIISAISLGIWLVNSKKIWNLHWDLVMADLLNIGGLAKPATALIEKVSDAIGVLYEPRRIVKKAEAEAEAERIKSLAQIEISEVERRGLERLIYQEGKSQENIERITLNAAQQLQSQAKVEGLEEDWIRHFFNRCERVSDVEMQTLWSSLLAGEATNPGTYSKRTVDFVATMDKKDAQLFTTFCQFTWVLGELTPVVFDTENEIYTSEGIIFSVIQHLDTIGLVNFQSVTGFQFKGTGQRLVATYFGKPVVLEFENATENSVQSGKVLFTQVGKELSEICGAKPNNSFFEYVLEQLRKQKITVSLPIVAK